MADQREDDGSAKSVPSAGPEQKKSKTDASKPARQAIYTYDPKAIDQLLAQLRGVNFALPKFEVPVLPDYEKLVFPSVSIPDYGSMFRSLQGIEQASLLAVNSPTTTVSGRKLSAEISHSREEYEALERKLKQAAAGAEKAEVLERDFRELTAKFKEYQAKNDTQYIRERVHPVAAELLLSDDESRQLFTEKNDTKAFVMSVDIRRSTELMLKAISPEAYADFLTKLCVAMKVIVTERYGVFDKFTGDGVLAFFPESYSGPDAAFHVVAAADACHRCFKDFYARSRHLFSSVLLDTGLGIGIDYGDVRLARVGEGLTVVGEPVVYACRLSGADPGQTLLNVQAFRMVNEKASARCLTGETELHVKHEGRLLAYRVTLSQPDAEGKPPDWLGRPESEATATDE